MCVCVSLSLSLSLSLPPRVGEVEDWKVTRRSQHVYVRVPFLEGWDINWDRMSSVSVVKVGSKASDR